MGERCAWVASAVGVVGRDGARRDPALSGGFAMCQCAAGYHAAGTACVLDTANPCMGVACSGHGTCSVVGGAPQCACVSGYHTVGADCVMDMPDPCAGVTCSGHGTCIAA